MVVSLATHTNANLDLAFRIVAGTDRTRFLLLLVIPYGTSFIATYSRCEMKDVGV